MRVALTAKTPDRDIAAFLAEQTNEALKPLGEYSDVTVADGRKLIHWAVSDVTS